MSARPRHRDESSDAAVPRLGILLSVAFHIAITILLIVATSRWMTTEIVAAGPGEGGEGGGAIDVGVADATAILGFARPQPISSLGERDNAINNAKVEHQPRDEETDDVVPRTDKEPLDPKSIKTDKPVVNQTERSFTGKDERGKSNSSAQVGRTYGSPTPTTVGGVAIGTGSGGGIGSPGGTEYGGRIQTILSRNYNPSGEASAVQTVIITLSIARDGRILNIINGRVDPSSIRQRAQFDPVNKAAERAILASNPLPPFPPGFLPGVGEVSVNLIFRYPK
ncbi:MAG: TonB C-terminal domain-containing protein [Blastocatellia bacterium]